MLFIFPTWDSFHEYFSKVILKEIKQKYSLFPEQFILVCIMSKQHYNGAKKM